MHSSTIKDARGKEFRLSFHPQRIISLICSITETIFDLGAGDRLIGRTNYCDRPRILVDPVRMIGGPKDPDIDLMISLEPDLVIANIEENEKHDVEKLEDSGIPVFVTYPRVVTDSKDLIYDLALLCGAEEKNLLIQAVSAIAEVRDAVASLKDRTKVVYLIWRKPYMTINSDTYIHDVIEFCGGENMFADASKRYTQITIENIIEKQPDVIILPDEPFKFLSRHRDEIMRQKEIPAVRSGRVYLADGRLWSWYGTPMIEGLSYSFSQLNHSSGL